MNMQTCVKLKIFLLTLLGILTAQGVLLSQGFRPLFKMDHDPTAALDIKQRSKDLKMNVELLMFIDAYEGMKSGETVDKIMPLAKDFLVMSGDKIALQVVATDVTACMESLKSKGATRIRHFRQVINCLIPMTNLSQLKNLPEVKRIDLVRKPATNIGAVTSQGDIAQLSDIARIVYGVNGVGNKIGVLSDSYDDLGGAMADIMTGDLPGATNPNGFVTPTEVLSDFGMGGSDEGRAMLQIIHDVAPGADLGFHTAFFGEADFAQGILDLNTAGCNIIVDDVFYFAEPYYMPGIIAQAVDQVCALGAMYFSSAGNADRNSYEGIYTAGPSIDNPMAPFPYISSHEFAPGDPYLSVALSPGQHIIILQWDQPFFSVTGGASATSDLDLYAYDTDLNIIAGSLDDNLFFGDPVEGIGLVGSGVLNLSVDFYAGLNPNRVKIIVYSSSPVLEFGNTAPTIVGHANTAGACAVGASAWFFTPVYGFGPPPGLNSFSSWGGVPIVYDVAGTPLPTPITYNKPDFVAPDGGNTTFFISDIPQDGDAYPNFFGTSASAPHAAAAAALIFEANPGFTKDEVKAALINTADDMLSPGFDFGSGAGLINVGAALSAAMPLNAGPNCQNINAAITPDGIARINLSSLIKNAAIGVGELDVTVHRGPVLITQRLNVYATDYLVLPNACALVDAELKVTISNALGSCWSLLTFKNSQIPYLPGRATTVYCDDDLVHQGGIGGTPPIVQIACGNEPIPTAKFVADWVTAYDCIPGVQDTVKIIMREWEAFDKRGNRGVAFDTIVVLQFPEITLENIYCEAKDTVYCADTTAHIGPFVTYRRFGICDTLYLVEISDLDNDGMLEFTASDFDDKCGLTVRLDAWKFGGTCDIQYKVIVEIKQSCYGTPDLTCPVFPPAGMAPNMAEQLGPGYWRCEFWVTDLDTLAPEIICKDSTTIPVVYTTSHECAAYSYLPPVIVKDDWSGVRQVKATIDGIGTAILLYNAATKCYESHTQFKLPHRELPYEVIYEAYDSCHNMATYRCYIKVKDLTRPIAITDKGVTVSLSDKKVWVDASTFDEGSWDNCGVNFLLARRSDWYESCIDLCDSIDTCWISEHHDTIWQAHLEPDKHLDAVEAHYAKTLEWFCEDNVPCGDLLYNAWQYDLMKYATLHCQDHPYSVDAAYFRGLIDQAIGDPEFAQKWKNPSTLFVGSSLFGGSENPAFYVQQNGSVTTLFDSLGVWGATTDLANQRILFTSSFGGYGNEGNMLYALPFGGGNPVLLGQIKNVGGDPSIRIDGLAISNGKVYGSQQFDRANVRGIYEIDLTSLEATLVLPIIGEPLTFNSGIGGIDGDPENGKIYGADDINNQIVEINLELGVLTKVADYPSGVIDIDGVAVGGGRIYLVPDRPGMIYVYNLFTSSYQSPISSPFVNAETFSAGAAYMPMLGDLVDEWSQIGGGWSDAVPFSCDDACGPVTVEILVMDFWCNWSTAWTQVWVEDLTPIEVAKDVVEQEVITCKVYKENNYSYPGEQHPVSIQYIVDQAKAGHQDGFDALDGIFGGYCKAWVDPYGNYVDAGGNEIACDIPFYDSICQCTSEWKQVRIYDDHVGYLWVDSLVTTCYYEPDTLNFQKGIVAVNCAQNVYCEQEVWCDFDHCGQGYIFRKFKIWQGCPSGSYEGFPDSLRHPVDTIYRHQRIWVGNECKLNKFMFDVPGDTEVFTCQIEYGPDGNVVGEADPENTGYATYQFDDDCRIVGIAHEDKVFKIVGGDAACYKILRTWYFADWCGYGGDASVGIAPVGKWWLDAGIVVDKCVQKIIVTDTVAPVCLITGPVADGDTIVLGACEYTLNVEVDAMDECGLIGYYWELKDVSDPDDHYTVESGSDDLSGDAEENFGISIEGLLPGTYKLKVQVKDECTNEGYCEYTITVNSGKKPTPVCITTLTARLTPWDSDNDGEVDSAHAVVWAYEFDRSSSPACGDDSLEYRIEFITDTEDDLSAAGDLDYLEVGCADIGTRLVRMWVISHPGNTRDYCDALLVVQSDLSGCDPPVGSGDDVMGYEQDILHAKNETFHKKMNGAGGDNQVSGDAGLTSGLITTEYLLEQNQPNPFQHETSIGFVLPESMEASLEVYDLTGRLLKSIKGNFTKGYHKIQFEKSDLRVSGVLYYRLRAGEFAATKKMILID